MFYLNDTKLLKENLLLKIKKGNGEKPTAPQAHSICIDAVPLVGEKESILKEPQHLGL